MLYMKRTTIALPNNLVNKLKSLFNTSTKTEAVLAAIQEAIRRRKIEEIERVAGTLRFELSADEIRHGGHRFGRTRSR